MDEERGVKQQLNREQFLQQRKDKLEKEAQKRLDAFQSEVIHALSYV